MLTRTTTVVVAVEQVRRVEMEYAELPALVVLVLAIT